MPYRKRSYYTRRRPRYNRASTNSRYVKKIVRSEIRKDDRKDHPLQWVDITYTGNYIKTTPHVTSLSIPILAFIKDNEQWKSWTERMYSGAATYRTATCYVTGYNYQLRFQQNTSAEDPGQDTVRTLAYSVKDTNAYNPNGILAAGDIDLPPDTRGIGAMYHDRVLSLTAGMTETTGDDSQFVPGQRIIKGYKKLYHRFDLRHQDNDVVLDSDTDIVFEHQSDDNSVIGEVELYGFIRVYYRLMD